MEIETLKKAPIGITERAITQLIKLKNENPDSTAQFLRIGVKGGGCSGMSYLLAFDQKTDQDHLYDINGLEIIMDRSHEMYVVGMEVDWEDGLNSRGFVFNNPNAKSTCGCGTSFSA